MPAQLGASLCPCAGTVSTDEYAAVASRVVRGLTSEPELLLEPLRERMQALGRAERFEEAADMRDRAAALAAALVRQRRLEQLRASGRVELDLGDAGSVELDRGRLTSSWTDGQLPLARAPRRRAPMGAICSTERGSRPTSPTSWRASRRGSTPTRRRSVSCIAVACSPRPCLPCRHWSRLGSVSACTTCSSPC